MLPTSDSEYVVTKDQKLGEILYNTVTFPAKIFAQSVIPTWQLLSVSKFSASLLPESISGQEGTTARGQFVENVVLLGVDFLIFIFGLIIVLLYLKRRRQEPLVKVVLLSFAFVILNSFIYALSPGRSGSIPVVDSRNVYLPAVGTSIFLATLTYMIMRQRVLIAILLFTPLIFSHVYWLNEQLASSVGVGAVRKSILQQVKREHPDLPEKVVFYVESDAPYYGMSVNIPPFETGLGQALLVWYYSTEKFPRVFFEDKFLRFITDQGYREENGRGFGYFRDWSSFIKAVKENHLEKNSIIAFSYDSKTKSVTDISIKTRDQLELNKGNQ